MTVRIGTLLARHEKQKQRKLPGQSLVSRERFEERSLSYLTAGHRGSELLRTVKTVRVSTQYNCCAWDRHYAT
jgi:hypothetical protein